MKNLTLLKLYIYNSIFSKKTMNSDWANLKKYEIENQTLTPTTKNVVFMGDSITEFWKIEDSAFFSSNSFINRGISGQTTPQMLLRFRQDVIDLKPSKVVILAGINDIAENTGPISLNQIIGNIISMVELAEANKIKVILCSVLPANNFNWNPKVQPDNKVIELNKLIYNFAKSQKINYVDYYSSMVDDQKGLQKIFGDDGVHPNLVGYKKMEALLLPFLSK